MDSKQQIWRNTGLFFCVLFLMVINANAQHTVFDRIQPLLGVRTKQNGPNCFHGAFYGLGISNNLRYVSEREAEFWITSSYCSEISKNELSAGDVVYIYDKSLFYTHADHAALFFNSDQVFEKEGFESKYTYQLSGLTKIEGDYPEGEGCMYIHEEEDDCHLRYAYRRCSDFATWYASVLNQIAQPLLKAQITSLWAIFKVTEKEWSKIYNLDSKADVDATLQVKWKKGFSSEMEAIKAVMKENDMLINKDDTSRVYILLKGLYLAYDSMEESMKALSKNE